MCKQQTDTITAFFKIKLMFYDWACKRSKVDFRIRQSVKCVCIQIANHLGNAFRQWCSNVLLWILPLTVGNPMVRSSQYRMDGIGSLLEAGALYVGCLYISDTIELVSSRIYIIRVQVSQAVRSFTCIVYAVYMQTTVMSRRTSPSWW